MLFKATRFYGSFNDCKAMNQAKLSCFISRLYTADETLTLFLHKKTDQINDQFKDYLIIIPCLAARLFILAL